jgi:hypothetical protein
LKRRVRALADAAAIAPILLNADAHFQTPRRTESDEAFDAIDRRVP